MTLNAVNSFITNTPHVPVGLLFPKGLAEKQSIIAEVRDSSRVHTRDIENHFQNWNPTQHKLDIQKFSDQFDTIFWLDSDAVVVFILSFLFPFSLYLIFPLYFTFLFIYLYSFLLFFSPSPLFPSPLSFNSFYSLFLFSFYY